MDDLSMQVTTDNLLLLEQVETAQSSMEQRIDEQM
jgi:hypothetical protein